MRAWITGLLILLAVNATGIALASPVKTFAPHETALMEKLPNESLAVSLWDVRARLEQEAVMRLMPLSLFRLPMSLDSEERPRLLPPLPDFGF